MTKLTLADLPRATKPGQAGVRVDKDGRVWIPWGFNVTHEQYALPKFLERYEWEQLARAGGYRNTGQIQISLCKCSYCRICIGKGYYETELYLRPVIQNDVIEWKTACGGCAVRDFNLSFGFCLISHNDWSGPHHGKIVRAWHLVYEDKCAQLEDELVDAFNRFELVVARKIKEAKGTLKGYPRAKVFQQFIATRNPTPLTFNDLYEQRQQRQHATGEALHAA